MPAIKMPAKVSRRLPLGMPAKLGWFRRLDLEAPTGAGVYFGAFGWRGAFATLRRGDRFVAAVEPAAGVVARQTSHLVRLIEDQFPGLFEAPHALANQVVTRARDVIDSPLPIAR
jgi:hypothetical protein